MDVAAELLRALHKIISKWSVNARDIRVDDASIDRIHSRIFKESPETKIDLGNMVLKEQLIRCRLEQYSSAFLKAVRKDGLLPKWECYEYYFQYRVFPNNNRLINKMHLNLNAFTAYLDKKEKYFNKRRGNK